MYQIGRVVSFQVDPEIVLRKRRVVKYRLLKKGVLMTPNYTLELRIIHNQKLIPAAAGRQLQARSNRMALKSISLTTGMHLLARFSKVVLGLALLSWPVIGYSLRMSNADWVDPIFKPTRIAADIHNCESVAFWFLVSSNQSTHDTVKMFC